MAIYFRYTVTGICMVLCGFYFGRRFKAQQIANVFLGVFLIAIMRIPID